MSKVIYKFILIKPIQVIDIPDGAIFLTLRLQGDGIRMWWYIVDTEAKKSEKIFETFLTGELMDDSVRNYLGTVERGDGEIVHVFERIPLISKTMKM